MAVNATRAIDARSADSPLQWVATWLHGRDKTRSEMASDLVFFVAGGVIRLRTGGEVRTHLPW
jgi:hypothetical protein